MAKITKSLIATFILLVVAAFIMHAFYFQPAVGLSRGQGTVLSDNWFASLNWIKENTAECAVVATYWDPGHFITGIGERAVVFDGASQNSLRTIAVEGELTLEEIQKTAVTDDFTVATKEKGGKIFTEVTTARIQDIATTFYTDNETMAMEILKKYRKEGCDEMYFIASSDLVSKSFWWTYFSTWNPVDLGCATPMTTFQLTQSRPSLTGGVTSTYVGGIPNGCNTQAGATIVITSENETTRAFLLQNNQLVPIKNLFYFTQNNALLRTEPEGLDGLVWLPPHGQFLIYVPEQIKDSMFTHMFLFNGQGLENFELVNDWGGEVKLFRVKFDDV